MNPSAVDRRNHEDELGFVAFRRFYSLSKIGKGLITFAAVAGVVGGCFAWSIQAAGQRLVSTRGEKLDLVADTAIASLRQTRQNLARIDSVAMRVTRLEDVVSMLGEIKCRELRAQRLAYYPATCNRILREDAQ